MGEEGIFGGEIKTRKSGGKFEHSLLWCVYYEWNFFYQLCFLLLVESGYG